MISKGLYLERIVYNAKGGEDTMPVKINSATYRGIDGILVEVEVDVRKSIPSFSIVGLPSTSIKESRERVKSAIINSGLKFPLGKIIINLAPSDIKKEGTLFDLPIAIAILTLGGIIKSSDIEKFLILGELSLNGELRGVKGILPIVIEAKKKGIKNFIIPYSNLNECSLIDKINIYPFAHLKEVINFLIFRDMLPATIDKKSYLNNQDEYNKIIDYNEVMGHESNKRALEIAAAGNHNILLFGNPGSGKTMLANRLCTILPSLTHDEILENIKIYSVSGRLKENKIENIRPFRSPHHSATVSAIVGGGKDLSVGEITLAHNGVLYLDEILEFKKDVLESLRQPMEDKAITVSRANGSVRYPSNFLLLASMNPCPCGFYLSSSKNRQCTCTFKDRKNYVSKLSGPILDRMDIFSYVAPLDFSELHSEKNKNETSEIIKGRVEKAREIQRERFKRSKLRYNSELNHAEILDQIFLSKNVYNLLQKAYDKYSLTTRAYDKIIKLSRTIADLEGEENIREEHVGEAFQYRRFIDNNVI